MGKTGEATKYLRSSQGAEAAGDFLVHFDHADVLLGLDVGEGHASIPREGQDVRVEFLQAIPTRYFAFAQPVTRTGDWQGTTVLLC